MDDELKRLAVAALREAADRLRVDPFRLARFLADGRLAEILTGLRETGASALDRETFVHLAERYRAFLEHEAAHVEGGHDNDTSNGSGNG